MSKTLAKIPFLSSVDSCKWNVTRAGNEVCISGWELDADAFSPENCSPTSV